MVSARPTVTCCTLLDSGGRTSTRSGCKSYNGETSREEKESASVPSANTPGTDLWSRLHALSAVRGRSWGDIQALGPPDPRTPQGSAHVMLLLLYRPEKSGADLSWWIFNETRQNRAGKVVVRV